MSLKKKRDKHVRWRDTCIKLARPDTNLGINSLENKSVQVMHGNKIKQG